MIYEYYPPLSSKLFKNIPFPSFVFFIILKSDTKDHVKYEFWKNTMEIRTMNSIGVVVQSMRAVPATPEIAIERLATRRLIGRSITAVVALICGATRRRAGRAVARRRRRQLARSLLPSVHSCKPYWQKRLFYLLFKHIKKFKRAQWAKRGSEIYTNTLEYLVDKEAGRKRREKMESNITQTLCASVCLCTPVSGSHIVPIT